MHIATQALVLRITEDVRAYQLHMEQFEKCRPFIKKTMEGMHVGEAMVFTLITLITLITQLSPITLVLTLISLIC